MRREGGIATEGPNTSSPRLVCGAVLVGVGDSDNLTNSFGRLPELPVESRLSRCSESVSDLRLSLSGDGAVDALVRAGVGVRDPFSLVSTATRASPVLGRRSDVAAGAESRRG